MDAIIFLKQEHKKIRQQLAAISISTNEKTKLSKFNNLCKDLVRHETMEQKVWYPVLRKCPELRDILSIFYPNPIGH